MEFLQQLINGIALGSVYALIALGYTMVYGIIKLINFAHGDIMMVGAYVGYFVILQFFGGISLGSYIAAIFLSMIFCALLGVVMEKSAYKPLRNAPRINALITAIGVSFLLENGCRVIPFVGPNYRPFPTFKGDYLTICEGLNISLALVIQFVVSVFLMFVLNYIVNNTKTGKAMRAVSQDRNAAYLMGIDVNRTISITFAIGSALAAAAGILYVTAYPQIHPYVGFIPGLKAFIAAVLGGIGSIPGAMFGGIILGVAETLTKGFISSKLSDAIAFGILILILIIKPAGLLGKNVREKV